MFIFFVVVIGVFLIYISLDYVFDGINLFYREEDILSFLNLYGKIKLEGEKVVLENNLGKIVSLVFYCFEDFFLWYICTFLIFKNKKYKLLEKN